MYLIRMEIAIVILIFHSIAVPLLPAEVGWHGKH